MTDETKQLLKIQLSMLKQTMKDNDVILSLAIDREDFDKTKIYFMDRDLYLKERKTSGISVSLTDFNEGLI